MLTPPATSELGGAMGDDGGGGLPPGVLERCLGVYGVYVNITAIVGAVV